MTPRLDNSSLGRWVDRTSRMVGYRDEALDFLERAGRQLPVFESDIGLVCRLWSVADEHDELVCRALTEFDSAVFESAGELDITRGAETRTTSDNEPQVVFLCTWSIVRPEGQDVSCILYGEQMTGAIGMEIRDHRAAGRPVDFPVSSPTDLYMALSDTFFALAAET